MQPYHLLQEPQERYIYIQPSIPAARIQKALFLQVLTCKIKSCSCCANCTTTGLSAALNLAVKSTSCKGYVANQSIIRNPTIAYNSKTSILCL
jgi:hypothetical protein